MSTTSICVVISAEAIIVSIILCRIASELRSMAHYLEQLDWKHSKEYKI